MPCDLFVATTGRAGSLSLARMLDAQHDYKAVHEPRPFLPWDAEGAPETIPQRLERLRGDHDGPVAEVSLWLLPYVRSIITDTRAKVLFLLRDRQETIDSYERKLSQNYPARVDHWNPDRSACIPTEWDACYPKMPGKTRAERIGAFWDHYYAEAERWVARHPDGVALLKTQDLNNPPVIEELMAWLGVPVDRLVRRWPHVNRTPRVASGLREKVTILIPTFERPKSFAQCVKVIGQLYPDVPIIAADDSYDRYARAHMEAYQHPGGWRVLEFPPDCGVGFRRNRLVDAAQTPWVFLCDDDFQLRPDVIERLLGVAEAHGLDVAAGLAVKKGGVCRWEAVFDVSADRKHLTCRRVMPDYPYTPCHLTQNVCVMRRELAVRAWDDRLKIFAEHMDAFLRLHSRGAKVGAVPGVFVDDDDLDSSPTYRDHRHGGGYEYYENILLANWGFEAVTNPNGYTRRHSPGAKEPVRRKIVVAADAAVVIRNVDPVRLERMLRILKDSEPDLPVHVDAGGVERVLGRVRHPRARVASDGGCGPANGNGQALRLEIDGADMTGRLDRRLGRVAQELARRAPSG